MMTREQELKAVYEQRTADEKAATILGHKRVDVLAEKIIKAGKALQKSRQADRDLVAKRRSSKPVSVPSAAVRKEIGILHNPDPTFYGEWEGKIPTVTAFVMATTAVLCNPDHILHYPMADLWEREVIKFPKDMKIARIGGALHISREW